MPSSSQKPSDRLSIQPLAGFVADLSPCSQTDNTAKVQFNPSPCPSHYQHWLATQTNSLAEGHWLLTDFAEQCWRFALCSIPPATTAEPVWLVVGGRCDNQYQGGIALKIPCLSQLNAQEALLRAWLDSITYQWFSPAAKTIDMSQEETKMPQTADQQTATQSTEGINLSHIHHELRTPLTVATCKHNRLDPQTSHVSTQIK